MKLLIVEPESSGHRMVLYVRSILDQAAINGWDVALLTAVSSIGHPGFKQTIADYPDTKIYTFELKSDNSFQGTAGLILKQFLYYYAVRKAIARALSSFDADLVYMSTIDPCDKFIALFGAPSKGVAFVGLQVSLKFHRSAMKIGPESRSDWLYQKLFLRLLKQRYVSAIGVIDEAFYSFAQTSHREIIKQLHYIPDVGELIGDIDRPSAKEVLGIPGDVFAILIYGSLSKRKGIIHLLEIADKLPSDFVIVLAGNPDEDITQALGTDLAQRLESAGRLYTFLHFHSDQEELTVFRAVDLVWIAYVGGSFGSSGVMYQAGSAQLPVVSSSQGLIGWLVKQHETGIIVDPLSVDAAAARILGLREAPEQYRTLAGNGCRLAKKHTRGHFSKAVTEMIERAETRELGP